MAPSRWAVSITLSTGTNRNSACWSTNFLMSHGQATRSTFTRSLVTYFMFASSGALMALPRFSSFLLGIQGAFDAPGQFFGRPLGPEVREIISRLLADHVVVQGDDVDVRFAQGPQHRLHFLGGHDEVAIHRGQVV